MARAAADVMQELAASLSIPDLPAFLRCFKKNDANLPEGTILCRRGDPATRLWLVVEGSVSVGSGGATGNESPTSGPSMVTIWPGQAYGFEALHQHLHLAERTAQVRSSTENKDSFSYSESLS